MKKKIVLVFPFPRPPSLTEAPVVGRLPYSLLYLARNLKQDYEVRIFDERIKGFDLQELLKSADEAVCVGVSVFTGFQIKAGLDISRRIKEHNPAVQVVWGGWHPTLDPRQTLQEKCIDIAVIGQGEQTFLELAKCLEQGPAGLPEVKGIAFREGAEVRITPAREHVNPDSFPPVDFSFVDCSKYLYKTDYSEKSIGLFTSHGCPHCCAFCSIYKIYGRRWLPKTTEHVLEELKALKRCSGMDSVIFDDDNFFVNKDHVTRLLQGIIKENLNIKWAALAHSSSFIKIADDAFMDLIKRSGCEEIMIGAETGNDEIMKMVIDKHAAVKDTYEFVKLLKKWDITPRLSTMVGFPYGDGSDYLDTVNMIARCKNIFMKTKSMIAFYTPYPGTKLYSYAIEHGFKPPETLEAWGRHSLTRFRAPWVPEKVHRFIRNFSCFYAYYYDEGAVGYDRNFFKVAAKSVLYALGGLRFRLNFFRFQADADLFYAFLRLLDKFKVIDLKTKPWADYY